MKRLFISLIIFLNITHTFSQQELTHEVYFDTDKYDLTPTEQSRLLLFISQLANVEVKSVSIYGFSDDVGAESYNLALSQKRAETIKTIFSENEINQDVITNVDGRGELLLKIVNEKDISKTRGLNRKVEIILTAKTPEEKKQEILVLNDSLKIEMPQQRLKKELKAGDKIVLHNILFQTGFAIMEPESVKRLAEISKILKKRDDIYFTIQGHVCCTQFSRDAIDRKTNLRNLSDARAKYIYDYFASKGIDKKRMKFVGLRRLFPLGGDPKYDKRVELLITYSGGKTYIEDESNQ